MPFSKNLNSYTDVLRVLQTARQHGGLRYQLPSHGKAVNWRAKAYYYRALLVSSAKERAGLLGGFNPSTEWDDLQLTVEGNIVVIQFGLPVGRMVTLNGEVVEPVPYIPPETTDAEALLGKPGEPAPLDPDLLAHAKKLLG